MDFGPHSSIFPPPSPPLNLLTFMLRHDVPKVVLPPYGGGAIGVTWAWHGLHPHIITLKEQHPGALQGQAQGRVYKEQKAWRKPMSLS